MAVQRFAARSTRLPYGTRLVRSSWESRVIFTVSASLHFEQNNTNNAGASPIFGSVRIAFIG
jgi:hypothetical protein